MTNVDIYSLLSSKPHNPHYLKRYIKYLNLCEEKNKALIDSDPVENHHILPKAKDLFPEYKDFSQHPWNKITLTPYQHIWVHLILYKLYGGSQVHAVFYMFNVQNASTNYDKNRVIPSFLEIRYAAKLKQEHRNSRKGMATYKDKDGNKYFLHKNDPLIQQLNLVGNNHGYKMPAEYLEKAKVFNESRRKIRLYHSETFVSKNVLITEKDQYLNTGWKDHRDELWVQTAEKRQSVGTSEALTGTMYYYYPDGTYYGKRLPKDSPLIKELGLLQTRSQKQKAQATDNALKNAKDPEVQRKKSEKMSCNIWCYDPVTKQNTRCQVVPDGWIVGKYGESPIGGSSTWNDGVRNYRVKIGQTPEPHWIKGMLPRK